MSMAIDHRAWDEVDGPIESGVVAWTPEAVAAFAGVIAERVREAGRLTAEQVAEGGPMAVIVAAVEGCEMVARRAAEHAMREAGMRWCDLDLLYLGPLGGQVPEGRLPARVTAAHVAAAGRE
jgi:hypothetical protein